MSPPEAPEMTLAISCARASASSVNSTCWTSASILGVRPAAPAAERIRSNVESSVAERQSTSWERPSAKVFPSPVTPTMSAAVAENRRRSGSFPPITSGMGSWIGLGSFRTAFLGAMSPPEREPG
jgi:hypothetical protein